MIKIKGVEVGLLGVSTQDTIDELGQIVKKHRLAHCQSFYFSLGNSANNRLVRDTFPLLSRGFCFLRILHHAHSALLKNKDEHIIISKVDVKSAHCCGATSAGLSSKSTAVMCGMALFLCCLPFGGAHCPNIWCLVLETMTVLGNDSLECACCDEECLLSPLFVS